MEERGTLDDEYAELRRWRGLFDHLPALVASWDVEMRNVAANDTYLEWFGLSPHEIRGRHIREVLGDPVFSVSLPYIEGALAGREQFFQRTLVSPTGQTRFTHTSYIPAIHDGEVTGFHGLVTDISEHVQSQRDLLEAQQLARMGSFGFDPATEQLTVSPALQRILGRAPDGPDPTFAEYVAAIHPDDRERVAILRAGAERGQDYETDYRIVRPDGEIRHVHSRTRPVRDAHGEIRLLRGVIQDETDTQRLASELLRSNTVLTDLIGVLGHDLRQPISVVRGYLEEADDSWEEVPEADLREHVRTALRATASLDSLLTDILTMVNLDTAALATHPEDVAVGPLVESALAALPLDAELHDPSGVRVHADPAQVGQILTNLLSNAVRYGAAPYSVAITVDGPAAVVEVRDHGEGVPPDFVPRLFTRFSRASSGIATTVHGIGFGLHIVRELARANGGDVSYVPGRTAGAVFRVLLPLAGQAPT